MGQRTSLKWTLHCGTIWNELKTFSGQTQPQGQEKQEGMEEEKTSNKALVVVGG